MLYIISVKSSPIASSVSYFPLALLSHLLLSHHMEFLLYVLDLHILLNVCKFYAQNSHFLMHG